MGSFVRLFDTFNITGLDKKSAPLSLPFSSSTSPEEAASQAAEASTTSTNKAIADVQAKNDAAAKAVKDAQDTASKQATNRVRARAQAASQSVYTSPLGLAGMADTIRKTLTGQ